jgi:geranylgeranyl reductase family protein
VISPRESGPGGPSAGKRPTDKYDTDEHGVGASGAGARSGAEPGLGEHGTSEHGISEHSADENGIDEFSVDERWDVAVVGAGPAGASAARAAAEAGARVVLLEKAALPRYKTCGGGLIGYSRRSLPPGLDVPVRQSIDAVSFSYDGGKPRTRRDRSGALLKLVNRADFDHALAKAAIEAGASLRERTAVAAVAETPDGFPVLSLADGSRIAARAVVGADGSASRTARFVGVRFGRVDLGLEAEIPVPPDVAALWSGRVLIDYGPVPGSYGWVFPKGDVLTVGVIAARGTGEAARAYYRAFVERLGLDGFEAVSDSGHLTRCRTPDSPLSRGRILVAGDAAGLLEPFTREGISYALRSGTMAGAAAARIAKAATAKQAERAAQGYREQVEQVLGVEMDAGERLLAAFEKHPRYFQAAVTTIPQAWQAFAQFCRGQTTFAALLGSRTARAALRALS